MDSLQAGYFRTVTYADSTAPEGPAAGSGLRDCLVVALGLTTGAADVTTFLILGKVFSSVITGNLVLLGLAAGSRSASDAVHAGLAVGGYAAGVAAGTIIARRGAGTGDAWPVSVTAALSVELALLCPFTALWEATGRQAGPQLTLLAFLAAAMGVQTAAVRQLGQMSSTYLTSTFAGLVAGLITRGTQEGRWRSAGVIVSLLAGAYAGALLLRSAPGAVPALIAAPLAAVIGAALVRRRVASAGG